MDARSGKRGNYLENQLELKGVMPHDYLDTSSVKQKQPGRAPDV
jgi:hypothetical protein